MSSATAQSRFSNGVYGVVGHEIGYSLSPYIFRTAFQGLNWRADYALFDIGKNELRSLLNAMRIGPIRGLSVTKPYKESVIPHLDRLDESANVLGAANTIVKHRGRLVGYNTDVAGVVTALRSVRSRLRGADAVIFGAGGGARAVAFALLNDLRIGSVTIAARRQIQATRMIHGLQDRMQPHLASAAFRPASDLHHAISNAALVVNATPIGTPGHTAGHVLPKRIRLHPKTIAFDLVYRPRPSQFSREAQRAGCRTIIDGWPMLVAQAEAAFELWTGRSFPVSVRRLLVNLRQLP